MPTNSIIDNDNAAQPFALEHVGAPFATRYHTASFDEVSSVSSDREDFLLVLVSSKWGSATQAENQKRALAIIDACGIQPEVLDAADPANSLVRDELCEMSGIRRVFPQFFLVQGDRTSFFADFAELEHMNEEGTLAEWLRMELPTEKSNADKITASVCSKSLNQEENLHRRMECDRDDSASSTTEDIFNFTPVSNRHNSVKTDNTVPNTPVKQHHIGNKNHGEKGSRSNDIVLSTQDSSMGQEEWSDPLLLEKYEDEILALEDYLQEREEQYEEQSQQEEKNRESSTGKMKDQQVGDLEEEGKKEDDTPDSPMLQHRVSSDEESTAKEEEEGVKESKYRRDNNGKSPISVLSVATTATITPTSSSSPSRSPDEHRRQDYAINHHNPLSSPLQLSRYTNSEKDIMCNVSMETSSTRSETEQMLRAEVERLSRKCEGLSAERYIMEGELKEARRMNYEKEGRSSHERDDSTIQKVQLQQTLRCGYCMGVFKSNPSSLNAPISSKACGHSICRNCCHKRLSPLREAVRRRRDDVSKSRSERLRRTISNDLFMCGIGDMNQLYSTSFEEEQRRCEECPICHTPKAFRHGKLDVNESLCVVLKLLDS